MSASIIDRTAAVRPTWIGAGYRRANNEWPQLAQRSGSAFDRNVALPARCRVAVDRRVSALTGCSYPSPLSLATAHQRLGSAPLERSLWIDLTRSACPLGNGGFLRAADGRSHGHSGSLGLGTADAR